MGTRHKGEPVGRRDSEYIAEKKQEFLDRMENDPEAMLDELYEYILDEEIFDMHTLAHAYGMSYGTFTRLLKKCPAAREGITDALIERKVDELHRIAERHIVEEVHVIQDGDGTPVRRIGVKRWKDGDLGAIRTILFNRRSEEWRDKVDHSIEINSEQDLSYDAFEILKKKRNAEFEKWLADRDKASNTEQGGEQ